MGTKQSSQCPEPLNPAFAPERQFFEELWLRIVRSRQQKDPNCRITWVPEYGWVAINPWLLSILTLYTVHSHIIQSELLTPMRSWRTVKENDCKRCLSRLLRSHSMWWSFSLEHRYYWNRQQLDYGCVLIPDLCSQTSRLIYTTVL